eukprot:6200722-Pleurochrysis_carterae.AAC.4
MPTAAQYGLQLLRIVFTLSTDARRATQQPAWARSAHLLTTYEQATTPSVRYLEESPLLLAGSCSLGMKASSAATTDDQPRRCMPRCGSAKCTYFVYKDISEDKLYKSHNSRQPECNVRCNASATQARYPSYELRLELT